MDIRNECLSTIWLLGDFVLEALTHFNGIRVISRFWKMNKCNDI